MGTRNLIKRSTMEICHNTVTTEPGTKMKNRRPPYAEAGDNSGATRSLLSADLKDR